MKLLSNSDRTALPADSPTTPPVVIIINDPSVAQHLYQPVRPAPPQHHAQRSYKVVDETRLQGLIHNERELLQDAWHAFSSATRAFLGTLVSWFMWRVVVPLSVVGMLMIIAADLPW